MAIPPAYTDVWICADPRGHLQATGRDARRRKQYRYHARWRRVRDKSKFEHMWEIGTALPRIRRKVTSDLRLKGWPKEKVLALVVRLLDQTLIRVGNEAYANENGNYGLTTLRGRHARSATEGLRLYVSARSGRQGEVTLSDKRLVRMLRRVHQLPGQRLSYIHPTAFRGWEDGSLQRTVSLSVAKHPRMLERAALRFLRRH